MCMVMVIIYIQRALPEFVLFLNRLRLFLNDLGLFLTYMGLFLNDLH